MKYLLILALLGAVFSTVELCEPEDSEIMKHTRRTNCLQDYPKPDRLIPGYSMSARQKNLAGVEYVGPINWGIAYAKFLPDFICKCALKALELNHRFFGIQFFGECWTAAKVGKPRKSVTDCVTGNFQPCGKKDKFCTGKYFVNAVYAIKKKWFNKHKGEKMNCTCENDNPECVHTEHSTLKECLEDDRNNRLLPEYAMSAREDGLVGTPYVGPVNWATYTTFLPNFICQCAKRACKLHHRFYGIQFYGECWSAAQVGNPKITVTDCVNENFNLCNLNTDKYCTGKRYTNAVYAFDESWFNQNCV